MKSVFMRLITLLLTAVFVFSAAACTGAQPAVQPEPSSDIQGEEVQAEAVPENGQPDKSAYPHVDAIESYKKTDWKANWIWTSV